MALVHKKKAEPINYTSETAARIQQLRLQLLVHSYLYYSKSDTLISDKQWDAWAKELVKLQTENPNLASKVVYSEAFKDFDGTSGFNLPYTDDNIAKVGNFLLQYDRGEI